MRPKIWLGLLSSTRLSVTLLLLGWLKLTCAADPTLKLCQSMAARWLLWLTFSTVALWLMTACPATTCPPEGNWVGTGLAAQAIGVSTQANNADRRVPPSTEVLGPCDLASSEATTHCWVASCQTMRYCLFMRAVPSKREGHNG